MVDSINIMTLSNDWFLLKLTKKSILLIYLILLCLPLTNVYGGSCFAPIPDIKDCRLRAEQGDTLAQNQMGLIYRTGDRVPQDYQEAIRWYKKAFEKKTSTQTNTAQLTPSDNAVQLNYKKAQLLVNQLIQSLQKQLAIAQSLKNNTKQITLNSFTEHIKEKLIAVSLMGEKLNSEVLSASSINYLTTNLQLIKTEWENAINLQRRKWFKVRQSQKKVTFCTEYTTEKNPQKWKHDHTCYTDNNPRKWTSEGWVSTAEKLK